MCLPRMEFLLQPSCNLVHWNAFVGTQFLGKLRQAADETLKSFSVGLSSRAGPLRQRPDTPASGAARQRVRFQTSYQGIDFFVAVHVLVVDALKHVALNSPHDLFGLRL